MGSQSYYIPKSSKHVHYALAYLSFFYIIMFLFIKVLSFVHAFYFKPLFLYRLRKKTENLGRPIKYLKMYLFFPQMEVR